MFSNPTLLVVDDEQVYCDGCERIFSRQGFRVEGSNDAAEALGLATTNEYSAILLDVKMPNMDGIRFLERLRTMRPDTPVILMTGYPSIQNAASAVRLGASDYVIKPFTPEEITSAVQGLLGKETSADKHALTDEAAGEQSEGPAQHVVFHGRGWAQLQDRAAVRVGGVVPRSEDGIAEIELPKVGDIVHQGLPLFALRGAAGTVSVVPTPVTGMVVEVNSSLRENPEAVWTHPCGLGWVAKIAPTRLDCEEARLARREILIVTANGEFHRFYHDKLTEIGCATREMTPDTPDLLIEAARAADVILLDAASSGDAGPALVSRLVEAAPDAKIVVVAPSGTARQDEYRTLRLFYYAVPPLENAEIIDVIDSCYRMPADRKRGVAAQLSQDLPLSTLHVTTNNGSRVTLLAPNGLLRHGSGLGLTLRNKIFERLLPVEAGLGHLRLTPARLLRELARSNRVIVLATSEMSRIAGALRRCESGSLAEFVGVEVDNVTVLAIQSLPGDSAIPKLDPATLDALAEHILGEMLV